MSIGRVTLGFFALLLFAQGCRTEPVTWRMPVHELIFLQDTLSWPNLVPDTLWSEGEDGLVLEVQAKRSLLNAEDLVPRLDTAWIDVLTLPFSGGPIPIAAGMSIWSATETIGLEIPNAGLRQARLGQGVLTISVSSTVQGPLTLRYVIDGAVFPPESNGGSEVVVIDVNAETTTVELDLAGVVLNLEGQSDAELSRLSTSWEVLVSPDAPDGIGVMGSDELTLSVDLSGLKVAQVEGRFDAQTWSLNDGLEVEGFEAVQELQVGWSELALDVVLHNTAGIDLSGTVSALVREDEVEGVWTTTALNGAALGEAVFLPRAAIEGSSAMNDWEVVPTEAGLQFSSEDGNLATFMGSLPHALSWSLDVAVNPLGDVSGGHDRVDLTQLPSMSMSLKAPLNVSSARAVFLDTLEVAPPNWLAFDGRIALDVESSLPVGVVAFLELVDVPETMHETTAIFPEQLWTIGEVLLPAGSGDPSAPVTAMQELDLSQVQFEALLGGARVMAVVCLETPSKGAQFMADQSIIIRGHLNGNAILSFE